MKRIVDPVAILSVSDYIKIKVDELLDAKKKLLDDIGTIKNYYKGVDAEIIINKYIERLQIIDALVINYNIIKKYLSNISYEYSGNLERAKKELNIINNDNMDLEDNLDDQTLSIDIGDNYEY